MIDDFTDPWTQPETVLLVHGLAESGQAWRAWVPHLARRWRVIRIDQRGFGKSTPMDEDFPWSVDTLAADLVAYLLSLNGYQVGSEDLVADEEALSSIPLGAGVSKTKSGVSKTKPVS